jgi:hypothetical protein
MTKTELARLVRKLYHRRKIAADIPEFEARISTYLAANNLSGLAIAGYRVEQTEEELVITPAPSIDENQLSLIPDYFSLEYDRRRR